MAEKMSDEERIQILETARDVRVRTLDQIGRAANAGVVAKVVDDIEALERLINTYKEQAGK